MGYELKSYLKDCSTETVFQFMIECESCGSIWKSRKIRYSHAQIKPETEGKKIIYETLFKREWKEALDQAVIEAREVFSLCPICGRLVCDRCFLLCDEIEMCDECAVKLKETGIPVV